MQPGAYNAGDYRLASDFRLMNAMGQLFETAEQLEWRVAYQINASRYLVTTEDRRVLRKQIARMELDRRFPRGLMALQESIVNRYGETSSR
jgi:hypothetical protein